MTARILIVDDEQELVQNLSYRLETEGFVVNGAYDASTGLRHATASPGPDLIVLDLMLPDMSGTDVCRRLREDQKTRDIPVLMLTARADEYDRVVGFESGADDYVVKPFSTRELVLRIRALLRRNARVQQAEEVVDFGCLRLDTGAHRVEVDGIEAEVTALEFRLLRTLIDRKGRVQSRDQLLRDVWEYEGSVTTRTVDTHVKRLREKLTNAGAYIETVRGVGYRFASDPE